MDATPNRKKRCPYSQLLSISKMQCEYDMCIFTTNKAEIIMQHVIEHSTTVLEPTREGFICLWRDCEFLSEDRDELLRHLYFHAFHAKVKAVGEVVKKSINKECLIESVGRNILPDLPEEFQCAWEECSVKFSSAQHFYWHTAAHANSEIREGGKVFCKWKDCKAKTQNVTRLKEHLRCHTQEKIIGCPTCGGLFSYVSSFENHIERQNDVPHIDFKCDHCDKCFGSDKQLREHVSKHIHQYKCPQCSLTTTTRNTLANHMLHRHSDCRTFACPECPKRFKTGNDLGRHLYTHANVNSYHCPYGDCVYSCKVPNYITTHITKVHSGKPGGAYQCHRCQENFPTGHKLTKHLKSKHDYHWPSGYKRFKYRKERDGYYRLQTTRFESVELAAQLDQLNEPASPLQNVTFDDSTT